MAHPRLYMVRVGLKTYDAYHSNVYSLSTDTAELSRRMPDLKEFKVAFYVSANISRNFESLDNTIGHLPRTIRTIVLRFASRVHGDKLNILWDTLDNRIESSLFHSLECVKIEFDVEGLSPQRKELEMEKMRSMKLYRRGMLHIAS